jgi:hypothetical protein
LAGWRSQILIVATSMVPWKMNSRLSVRMATARNALSLLACDEDAYRILIAPGQPVTGVEDQALRGAGKSRSWQRRRTGCIAQNMSLPQPQQMVFSQLGRRVVAQNGPFCATDSRFRHGRRDYCLRPQISRDSGSCTHPRSSVNCIGCDFGSVCDLSRR